MNLAVVKRNSGAEPQPPRRGGRDLFDDSVERWTPFAGNRCLAGRRWRAEVL